jgi:hypothetical protein
MYPYIQEKTNLYKNKKKQRQSNNGQNVFCKNEKDMKFNVEDGNHLYILMLWYW